MRRKGYRKICAIGMAVCTLISAVPVNAQTEKTEDSVVVEEQKDKEETQQKKEDTDNKEQSEETVHGERLMKVKMQSFQEAQKKQERIRALHVQEQARHRNLTVLLQKQPLR